MSAWCEIRSIPSQKEIVQTESAAAGIEYYLKKEGYWARFTPLHDGNVVIRSHSGKYEDECHGDAYSAKTARNYATHLKRAGFQSSKEIF